MLYHEAHFCSCSFFSSNSGHYFQKLRNNHFFCLSPHFYFERGSTVDHCGKKSSDHSHQRQQPQQHQQHLSLLCGNGEHRSKVQSHRRLVPPPCIFFNIILSSRTSSYFWTHVETTFLSGHMSVVLRVSRCVVRSSILLRAGDSSRLSRRTFQRGFLENFDGDDDDDDDFVGSVCARADDDFFIRFSSRGWSLFHRTSVKKEKPFFFSYQMASRYRMINSWCPLPL